MSEKRGRKDKETEQTTETHGKYTVTKPAEQYVVNLGGSVVYASAQRTQIDQYLKLVGAVK